MTDYTITDRVAKSTAEHLRDTDGVTLVDDPHDVLDLGDHVLVVEPADE